MTRIRAKEYPIPQENALRQTKADTRANAKTTMSSLRETNASARASLIRAQVLKIHPGPV